MPIKPNQKLIERAIASKLGEVADRCVDVCKDSLHFDTGRMAASTGRGDAEKFGERFISRITVGGKTMDGIYREEGEPKFVDYAIVEEMRHPQLRREAIPTIIVLSESGDLLDYQLQRVELI